MRLETGCRLARKARGPWLQPLRYAPMGPGAVPGVTIVILITIWQISRPKAHDPKIPHATDPDFPIRVARKYRGILARSACNPWLLGRTLFQGA
jgi:hypothetical protein